MSEATLGRLTKIAPLAIVVLCCLVYAVRGYYDQRLALQSLDFKTVYGGAKCLMHGCDPYDSAQIFREYAAAGGPTDDMRPFRPHEPIYFPSALSLLTPFALLPWEPAHLVWLAVSTTSFVAGVLLVFELSAGSLLVTAVVLGCFVLTSTTLIMLAQPAQLTIGLCAIAVWCLLRDKHVGLGILCFALSLSLKPHVTGLIWLYFLLRDAQSRKTALKILLATLIICLPGIVWASVMPASSHWMKEIPANIRGITAHGLVGDPGPANDAASSIAGLHPLLSLFRDDPAFYNQAAAWIGLVLLAVWLVPVLRMKHSQERDYIGVAAITCISLLPIYHREYDTRILLLTFPAFSYLLGRGTLARITTVVVTMLTVVCITHNWINFATLHILPHIAKQNGQLTVGQTILWLRPVSIFTSLLTLFYLGWLYIAWMRNDLHRHADSLPGGCQEEGSSPALHA